MKIGYTFNIGKYEFFKIESSEHNHGSDESNFYEANKEILFIIEKKLKIIPELIDWYNKLKQELNI